MPCLSNLRRDRMIVQRLQQLLDGINRHVQDLRHGLSGRSLSANFDWLRQTRRVGGGVEQRAARACLPCCLLLASR
eukprot:681128-Hanusia_phi.AAC.1